MESQSQKPQSDPLVGQILGEAYRIVRRIGTGGMGAVYEAEHLRLPKRFAIKHLRQALVEDRESIARFKREAEIASSLGSRHIVEVIDFNQMPDGTPYMVMELLRGEDLGQRLRRMHRLPPVEALAICEQVVSALQAAHRSGIVHRDIKPENIFLCEGEDGITVKLLDFGLSKVRSAQGTLITQSESVLGTPAFMSPEQASGTLKGVDPRTDIYSLGGVMYQALTGHLPLTGENVYQLLMKIVNEVPRPMRDHVPSLPVEADRVIQCALAKDPARRFASVTEFWHALQIGFGRIPRKESLRGTGRALPDDAPVECELSGPTVVGMSLSLFEPGGAPSIAPAARKRSRKPLGLAAALAAVAVSGWLAFERSRPVEKPRPPVASAPNPNALRPSVVAPQISQPVAAQPASPPVAPPPVAAEEPVAPALAQRDRDERPRRRGKPGRSRAKPDHPRFIGDL